MLTRNNVCPLCIIPICTFSFYQDTILVLIVSLPDHCLLFSLAGRKSFDLSRSGSFYCNETCVKRPLKRRPAFRFSEPIIA